MHGCSQRDVGTGQFCRRHWRAIPADLKARIRWALDSEDEVDLEAALSAALDAIG